MVRVLCIGDLHFKKNELALADLVIQKLTKAIDENKPDLLVFLGDTLDTHEKIDMKAFNKSISFFKMLALKYPVVLIVGNHDRPDSTTYLTDMSAFYCLRDSKNIYVIDRVMDIEWALGPNLKPLRFVFVPYVPPNTFQKALDTLERDFNDQERPVTAVFCHQTFVGAAHGKTTVRSGDRWDEKNPLLISGHIHVHKVVQPNLIYAGTPYQLTFDDESKKGIINCIFTGKAEPEVRFIELDIHRMKSIMLRPEEVDNFVPPNDCQVKVEIVGTRAEIEDLTHRGIINRMRSKGVSVSLMPSQALNSRNPEGKSFRELVLASIQNDPEAREIYDEIFNDPDKPTNLKVEKKENLSNLLELMKTMATNPSAIPPPFSFTGSSPEIRDIKETPNYLVNDKGKPVEHKPTLVEMQKSLQASAAVEQEKPSKTIDLQSLINAAILPGGKKQ